MPGTMNRPAVDAYARRDFAGKVEIREGEGGKKVLRGEAVVYGELSVPLWGFREKIRAGAFSKSLGEHKDDIRALAHHDSRSVLGRLSAKTLRLEDTPTALRFEVDLPDTTYARDLVESITRGDITGVSFGFRVNADSWDEDDQGVMIREVTEARLVEISPVAFPAYPQSSVSARSDEAAAEEGRRILAERKKPAADKVEQGSFPMRDALRAFQDMM